MNTNKNRPEVSAEKLKELGLLKVISISVPADGEAKYRCINEEGETVFVPASKLGE